MSATPLGRSTRWISTRNRIGSASLLEHVRADHEVLAGVRDGGEPVGVEVGDNVGLRDPRRRELGKERPILVRLLPVDVVHQLGVRRAFEGYVPGTDLNSSTTQVRSEAGSSAPMHEPATVAQRPIGSSPGRRSPARPHERACLKDALFKLEDALDALTERRELAARLKGRSVST